MKQTGSIEKIEDFIVETGAVFKQNTAGKKIKLRDIKHTEKKTILNFQLNFEIPLATMQSSGNI